MVKWGYVKLFVIHQYIYHVGYTSSHSNYEVKEHWTRTILGWETLPEMTGSDGTIAVV
jgi:hypothetical protein